MDYVKGPYLETAVYVLLTAALGAAIFFWGRGIRRNRISDLIAGPAVLLALIVVVFATSMDSSEWSLVGMLLLLFGFATIWLSRLALPNGRLTKRELIPIGGGLVFVGIYLSFVS